jgi:hypothetical protein
MRERTRDTGSGSWFALFSDRLLEHRTGWNRGQFTTETQRHGEKSQKSPCLCVSVVQIHADLGRFKLIGALGRVPGGARDSLEERIHAGGLLKHLDRSKPLGRDSDLVDQAGREDYYGRLGRHLPNLLD